MFALLFGDARDEDEWVRQVTALVVNSSVDPCNRAPTDVIKAAGGMVGTFRSDWQKALSRRSDSPQPPPYCVPIELFSFKR